MKYPNWAPKELIIIANNFEIEETEFKGLEYDIETLNRYAWNEGFSSWKHYEKVIIFKKESLTRLISRPEMESVWKWIYKQNFALPITARGGLFGNFLYAVEGWFKAVQVPQSERDSDFKEIVKCAKTLAIKLQKYRGENQPINSYIALFSKSFKEKYKKQYDNRDVTNPKQFMMPIEHLALTMPPLSELLNELATMALNNQIDLPSYFPKKIRAENAFGTYLINNIIQKIYSLGAIPPITIVQKFIAVALDDYSVTPDNVRKSLALKLCRSEALKYGQLKQKNI